jgi:DNA replication and repair protein RecF
MYLSHLSLANFRNFARLELSLPPGLVLLHGDNAQGKTNLLEAVYVLATSRSPHTQTDRQLIRWGAEDEPMPYARLVGAIQTAAGRRQIEIVLVKIATHGGNQDRLQKKIKLDGVPRRALDLIGQVPVVIFSPRDIDLVIGSPGGRRRYLDATLCQLDSAYCRALSQYQHVVTQRNHLLRLIDQHRAARDELIFWDEKLIDLGSTLIARRYEIVARLNQLARSVQDDLTGGRETLTLTYWSSLHQERRRDRQLALLPDLAPPTLLTRQAVAELLRARLRERQAEEIARGVSVVGPHRDDLRFNVNRIDMEMFGSRGQQRTVALAVKIAETEVLKQAVGELPILLLDDVMSELDTTRRRYLMARIDQHQQTIITTTDLTDYAPEFVARARVLRVADGQVEDGMRPGG